MKMVRIQSPDYQLRSIFESASEGITIERYERIELVSPRVGQKGGQKKEQKWGTKTIRPYLSLVMSSDADSKSVRKLRVRAFDRYHFHWIWTSPAKDISESSWSVKFRILVKNLHFQWKYHRLPLVLWILGHFHVWIQFAHNVRWWCPNSMKIVRIESPDSQLSIRFWISVWGHH